MDTWTIEAGSDGVGATTPLAWLRALLAGDEAGARALLVGVDVGALLLAVSAFINNYESLRIGPAEWDAHLAELIDFVHSSGRPPGV
ncbi:hypothetical protein [Micromonospora aurantiaca (nom. illeg.)]|uniref:hypothetical protein n=1 Tax=Micromonospora aurantiaca (nom. illeg.) TaxID=47850 RepID=UPI003F4A2E6F